MKTNKIMDLVLRAVAVAMSVAAVVTNILKAVPVETQVLLLEISAFCMAITVLDMGDSLEEKE